MLCRLYLSDPRHSPHGAPQAVKTQYEVMLPFLRLTGQRWKVIGGWALIALGLSGIFTTVEHWWDPFSTDAYLFIIVGANLLNLLAFIGMVAFIRCPRCRARLFWHAISAKQHPGGLHWFFTFTSCPTCGFRPDPAAG